MELRAPPLAEWWGGGGGGGGVEKRARLTGLSQYKRLPLHIYLEGLQGRKRTDRKLHPSGMFQMSYTPVLQQNAQRVLHVCCYSLSRILLFFSLHPGNPPPNLTILVASGRFQRHY